MLKDPTPNVMGSTSPTSNTTQPTFSRAGQRRLRTETIYRERLKNREMPRRRPEFESGEAGAEAAKLEKFSDAGGSQSLWLSDDGRTDSSNHERCNHS